MSDQPTLTTCPGCYGPLAPDDARRRLVNGSCTACRVEPPDVQPGEILYCSRTGRELEAQDFRTGRAIRLYKRCISLDAIRDERAKMKESGEYGCDSCGARLTALDFLSGEAQVVDKVILCPRCRRKKPDPAGNGRSPKRSDRKAAARADEAASGGMRAAKRHRERGASESTSEPMRAAKKRTPDKDPDVVESDFTPAVVAASPSGGGAPGSEGELAGGGDQVMIGGAGMRDVVRASMSGPESSPPPPSASVPKTPPASAGHGHRHAPGHSNGNPHGHGHGHGQSHGHGGQPSVPKTPPPDLPTPDVVEDAPVRAHSGRAARVAGHGHALGHPLPGHGHGHARLHHGGSVQTADGVTIELATSRDLRWAAGAMVLMVMVLCTVLLIVFLNFQKVDPELNARLALLSEDLRSLRSDVSTLRMQQDSLQRDFERISRQGFSGQGQGTPANGTGPGIQPPPNVNRGQTGDPGTDTGAGTTVRPGTDGEASDRPPTNPLRGSLPGLDDDDPLAIALESPDSSIRLNAVLEANSTYNRRAIPHLLRIADEDDDPYVRAFAIRVLAAFRVAQARPTLEAIAAAARDDIVGDAATAALNQLQ